MMPRPDSKRTKPLLMLSLLVWVWSLAFASCSWIPAPTQPSVVKPGGVDVPSLHVLMINGGGNRRTNYQSHVLHIQQLLGLLAQSGVNPNQITVFSGDGSDPSADLAVRSPASEPEMCRLHGTRLYGQLRPTSYVNSEIPGISLQPATKASLSEWFERANQRLQAGDTLLLYVTGHGKKSDDDPDNNTITLWGKGESLSVRELRQLLERLDHGVRVVTLMSQCFSGSFYGLTDTHSAHGLPSGVVCGFFSSTKDRPAYGCYPENLGRENVGHSFHFLHGFSESGRFLKAHARVLVTDATPDVPLRTSEIFLHNLLRRVSKTRNITLQRLVDALLKEAWGNWAAWEPEIRLLDRIGLAFGLFSPRSLSELDQHTNNLPTISRELRRISWAWNAALTDSNRANLERFLTANPSWRQRTGKEAIEELDETQRDSLKISLLRDLTSFTWEDSRVQERIATLHERGSTASATSYRMAVRQGVVLRMRSILETIAGRVYLATRATPAQRDAYEVLVTCEDLQLPPPGIPGAGLATANPFPPYEEDVRKATAVLPAWMGIRFRGVREEIRTALGLEPGAARVITVYPDSPAQAARMQIGDIITGAPGQPFTEFRQVRSWTMLSQIGSPRVVELLRDGEPVLITLVPGPYPMKWPRLPGPPKVGNPAPPLKLSSYRGKDTDLTNEPRLLFFWTSWCSHCKEALPEVMDFERRTRIPVIAITDEDPKRLDAFFLQVTEFPETVALDEFRQTFQAYGVSGTPTFVLISSDGKVLSHSTGYSLNKGLGLADWEAIEKLL